MTTLTQAPVTFRRDRFGECWHLVPAGDLGPRGRTLCGEPRQGSRLSETYAEVQPAPPDCICARCTAVQPVAAPQPVLETLSSGGRVMSLATRNLSPRELGETRAFTRHTLGSTDGHIRPFRLPADTYTWAAPSWSAVVKVDQRVVTHAGILYRVIQVGDLRVPVGGIGGVMTLPDYRRAGNARAVLAQATAFIATQLWAPFAMVICPPEAAAFYARIGWHLANAPAIWCDQPDGRVALANEVAVVIRCQGNGAWPAGEIDLCGAPW